MTIGERIRKLRKDIKLSQAKFGERIGVKGATVGLYESGDRNVTDRVVSQISQAFNVHENWLRTGAEPRDLPQLSLSLADPTLDESERIILKMYLTMPHEKRRVLIDYIKSIAIEMQKTTSDNQSVHTEPTIDEKVAAYRAKLEAEEADKEK